VWSEFVMSARNAFEKSASRRQPDLTPEEDAIDAPDDGDDEIDDLLPADLWFRAAYRHHRRPSA